MLSGVPLQEESDLPYEEDILRHPYQIKCWLRYIEYKSTAPKAVINLLYERALKELPGRCVGDVVVDRVHMDLHGQLQNVLLFSLFSFPSGPTSSARVILKSCGGPSRSV